MTKKKFILSKLALYFAELGRIPSYREYIKDDNVPVRGAIVKRYFGSWNRLESLIKYNFPEEYALIFRDKSVEDLEDDESVEIPEEEEETDG